MASRTALSAKKGSRAHAHGTDYSSPNQPASLDFRGMPAGGASKNRTTPANSMKRSESDATIPKKLNKATTILSTVITCGY